MQLAIGSILNDTYRVSRLLGRGGQATVFVVEQLRLPRSLALKVLSGEYSTDPAFLARFRREAEILATLSHPNIVSILDFHVLPDSGEPYIIMELISGTDLSQVLARSGALPMSSVLPIFRQICDALTFAHGHGIVHRDLKPGNIMLIEQESAPVCVKVLDFGIAKVCGGPGERLLTDPLALIGTPPYMSPEQTQGTECSHLSDQFSLASILFELLTGRLAFAQPGEPVLAVLNRVAAAPVPVLDEIAAYSPALASALRRAWSLVPDERFPSVRDFAAAVTAAVEQRERAYVPFPSRTPAEEGAAPGMQTIPPSASGGRPLPETMYAPSRPSQGDGEIAAPRSGPPGLRRRRHVAVLLALSALAALAVSFWQRRAQTPRPTLAMRPVAAAQAVAERGAGGSAQSEKRPQSPPLPESGSAAFLPSPESPRPVESVRPAESPRPEGAAALAGASGADRAALRPAAAPVSGIRRAVRARGGATARIVSEATAEQRASILRCVHSYLGSTLPALRGKTLELRGGGALQEISHLIPENRSAPFHECIQDEAQRVQLPAIVSILIAEEPL